MKLSMIEATVKEKTGQTLGFTIKSKKTGAELKVIARTPSGRYLVVALSGKNKGGEFLVDDTERYVLTDDASTKSAKRITEIKAELKRMNGESQTLEEKMTALEEELENLEAAG